MPTTLTDYLFSLGEEQQIQVTFTVTAQTQKEAIEKANATLAEECEGHTFSLLGPAKDGRLLINGERVRVTAENIINESPSQLLPPEKAFAFLAERGYDWEGDEENWSQYMTETGEGHWNHTFATEENIYALLKLNARVDRYSPQWVFHFSMWMYPLAQNAISFNMTSYRIQVEAAHLSMSEAELFEWLPRYEKKFADLAFALRQADPEDGYALLPEEEAAGHIIHVDWRLKR